MLCLLIWVVKEIYYYQRSVILLIYMSHLGVLGNVVQLNFKNHLSVCHRFFFLKFYFKLLLIFIFWVMYSFLESQFFLATTIIRSSIDK